ncbi:Thioredoxin superfamily protein [Prunus dulcis]|uniref:Thioredoxin superfamily protein n=1 Tax=Prunus dulcis TaxID=3755 RepID=A0A4Y1RXG1_PRUDU|nr:Thioredoxin superfamily protein [Prunus dulcis]
MYHISASPQSQDIRANENRIWVKNTSVPTHGGGSSKVTRLYASKTVEKVGSDEEKGEPFKPFNDSDEEDEPCLGDKDDPYLMGSEERREWRSKIRQVLDTNPDVEEELDPTERTKKVQQLLANYPLVVEEDDPEWPDDADGRGFKLDQFFDKITIKNNTARKDDNDNDDSDNEIVWQDDNYIRPIKDVVTAEWEEAVFKDISPLIILDIQRPPTNQSLLMSCDSSNPGHCPIWNSFMTLPKENEKIRNELEKAVHIIWNCKLPSPRVRLQPTCIAVDAVTEHDLVSALKVSVFPEIIFTKAGKILYREKAIRSGDELSKVMAFFYYGAARPPCLNGIGDRQEPIPYVSANVQP